MAGKKILYHRLLLGMLIFILTACAAPQAQTQTLKITVLADGQQHEVQLAPGSSVQQALDAVGITLGDLDRLEPPAFTVLREPTQVRVVRVREEFDIVQQTIPFEQQTIRSEALPEGETRLLQAGENGLQEVTIRHLYEDGQEISRQEVSINVLREPKPEIVMLGSQVVSERRQIPGTLLYLDAGNVWQIEADTANRTPILTLGDLDGRVFSLSPDGKWLLFTRQAQDDENINTLWAAKLTEEPPLLIDLQVSNVVHFADWVPNSTLRVVYSTVEPRSAAPGWQANNDLQMRSFSSSGWLSRPTVVLDANAGGIYGWWGATFLWSPDGMQMAFSRPDGVGLVDFEAGAMRHLLEMPPLQTFGDWAWVPGIDWSPQGDVLYTGDHRAPAGGAATAETSPLFGLTALPLPEGLSIPLLNQTGMFVEPVTSPLQPRPEDEGAFQVAWLQALTPQQSDTSRYRLMVMDRDGSNRQALFPAPDAAGLEPQRVLWSPEPLPESGNLAIAVLYQGNLWLVDAVTGQALQVTGDGLVTALIWR